MPGSKFLAGGDTYYNTIGCIAYSNDGLNWTNLPDTKDLFDYCYSISCNEDMCVAVGDKAYPSVATIAYSYNGIDWTAIEEDIFYSYARVVKWFEELGVWVVGGFDRFGGAKYNIATSTDGLNWTGQKIGQVPAYQQPGGVGLAYMFGKAYLGLFYTTYPIYSSDDGINWSPVIASATHLSNICYGMEYDSSLGIMVAVGYGGFFHTNITWSDDGVNFNLLQDEGGRFFGDNRIYSLANNDAGMFVLATNGDDDDIGYSLDGLAWTGLGFHFGGGSNFITWCGTFWLASGYDNYYYNYLTPEQATNSILKSTDGLTWTPVTNDPFYYYDEEYEDWTTECNSIYYNTYYAHNIYSYDVDFENSPTSNSVHTSGISLE